MIWLGIIAALIFVALLGLSKGSAAAGPRRLSTVQDDPPIDQLGLLQQFGTPDDAERLMAQGVDLTALGYRPADRE